MSVRFTTSGDMLSSTATPPVKTAVTMMCWAKLISDTNAFQGLTHLSNGTVNYLYQGTDSDGTTHALYNDSTVLAGSALSIGVWYHFAWTCSGTGAGAFLGYLNGNLDITHAGNAGLSPDRIVIGKSIDGNQSNSDLCAFKCWDRVLSQGEVRAEMWTYQPITRLNLNRYHKLKRRNDHFDYSNYGRILTIGGSPASGPDPPRLLDLDEYSRRRRVKIIAAITTVSSAGWGLFSKA